MIARRSLCPEKLGSNPGQGSKGIHFSGWHGLDMSVTVTKRSQTQHHSLSFNPNIYLFYISCHGSYYVGKSSRFGVTKVMMRDGFLWLSHRVSLSMFFYVYLVDVRKGFLIFPKKSIFAVEVYPRRQVAAACLHSGSTQSTISYHMSHTLWQITQLHRTDNWLQWCHCEHDTSQKVQSSVTIGGKPLS